MFDKFENWLKKVLNSRPKQLIIITLTLFLFGFSVFAIYDKIVLAKMLPGKNNNTFTVYLDLASGSSINQTATVAKCVVEELQKEKEVLNIETFLGMGSPLDFAGLIKGSNFKSLLILFFCKLPIKCHSIGKLFSWLDFSSST
jgi:multidrug efflux pump subunit AcrB